MDANIPPAAAARPGHQKKLRSFRGFRALVIGVPIFLVCLVAALAAMRWWLDRFLQSEDFRRFLDRKVSVALRAESRLEPLHLQGSELYSAGLTSAGGIDSPWTSFSVEQVRADVNFRALWHHVWRIETVEIERLSAKLGANTQHHDATPKPTEDSVPPPASENHPLAALLPNKVEIGEVHVADLSLQWAADQPGVAGQIQGVRLVVRPRIDEKRCEIEGHGGRLTQAQLPAVELDDFAVKANEREVFITKASGRPETGGHLEFSGRQGLIGNKDLDVTLNYDGVPAEGFLPSDWRRRLHGNATGSAHVTGSPADPASWHATGHIELHDGRLEALPVLDELALFTSTVRYRQAVLQKGTADYSWSPNLLTVSNLVLESEGLLRFEGGFTVRGDQIDGHFQVGVAISAVRWLDQFGAVVFNEPQHDGYAWTTMHISGPLRDPHEDLTGRLATSAEKAVINKAKQGADVLNQAAGDLLNLLHGP